MRLLARTVLALLVTVGWLVPASTAYGQTTDLSDVGERAFSEIAACVAAADTLLVSVVVDQSGSLRNTDPANQRVGAIDTAVDALTGLRETAGGDLDVQMNLTVFDGGYEEIVGWGSLTADHPQRLRDAAARELPRRNQGALTDYRAALRGAKASLTARSESQDPSACKVVLWFTDGRLDVGPDTDRARGQLCEPQGIADSVRGSGIAVVALALFTAEGAGSVSPDDADLLRSVAEGTGESETCGTTPMPENYAPGAYLHAADAGALRRVFAGAGTLIEGGQAALSVTCPSSDCVEGQFRVPLDRGLSGFRLVLDGVQDDRPPVLRAPSGEVAELVSGSATLEGGSLSATTRDGLTVVDLNFPSGGSPGGTWVLDTQATPQQISIVDLYYFWGVAVEVRAPQGLTIGETVPLEAVISYANGTPVAPDDYQSLAAQLRVDGEEIALSMGSPGEFLGEYRVPSDGATAAVDITATVRAVSSPSSVALGPVTTALRLATVLPPAYATLLTTELTMPQIVGSGSTGASLRFRGSERGETRVCVGDVAVAGPELAGDIKVSTPEDCLVIPALAEVEWPVTLIPEGPADGRVEGTMTLNMSAVDGADTIGVDVPFGGSMMRPVNEPLRWLLVAVFVLIGLLIPVAIAVLTNHLNGRYRVSPRTVRAQVPATLTPAGLRPRTGGELLTVDDFQGLHFSGSGRVTSVSGAVTLVRRMPRWPFRDVQYEGRSEGEIVLSSVAPYARKGGQQAPGKSNYQDVFFLLVSGRDLDADHSYACQLVIFDVDEPSLSDVIERREDQLREFLEWEDLVAVLEDLILSRSGAQGPDRVSRVSPTGDQSDGTPFESVEPVDDRPSLWDEAGESSRGERPPDAWDRRDAGRGPTFDAESPGTHPDDPSSARPPSVFDD